ncbi:MAG: hypothetical protein Q4D38_07895 [Planctomycetia bacterium]|nr:hypothetical protein [Planctomycetia bacterium]
MEEGYKQVLLKTELTDKVDARVGVHDRSRWISRLVEEALAASEGQKFILLFRERFYRIFFGEGMYFLVVEIGDKYCSPTRPEAFAYQGDKTDETIKRLGKKFRTPYRASAWIRRRNSP